MVLACVLYWTSIMKRRSSYRAIWLSGCAPRPMEHLLRLPASAC